MSPLFSPAILDVQISKNNENLHPPHFFGANKNSTLTSKHKKHLSEMLLKKTGQTANPPRHELICVFYVFFASAPPLVRASVDGSPQKSRNGGPPSRDLQMECLTRGREKWPQIDTNRWVSLG